MLFFFKCQAELNMKSKFFLTDIYISGPFVTPWKFWHLPGIFSAIYFSLRPFMHSLECQPVKTTLLPQEGVIIRIILKVGMYYWFTKSWPYFWLKHAALYYYPHKNKYYTTVEIYLYKRFTLPPWEPPYLPPPHPPKCTRLSWKYPY